MSPLVNTRAIANLSPEDQRLFVEYGFAEREPVPFDCVHHAFEFQAATRPSATAVEHLKDSITYAELNRKANGLAQQLRAMGVKPGKRVCILVQRSIAMVVGILATLKAGAQYVPLDGGIVTQSTLDFVLEDSEATVVLVLKEFAHRVTSTPTRHVVELEAAIRKCDERGADCSKPIDLSSPNDGVYVIYTSGKQMISNCTIFYPVTLCLINFAGTTGKPKGVDVMHRNVTNCKCTSPCLSAFMNSNLSISIVVCLKPGNVGMEPGRRVAQLLNIAFDMCAWEVLGSMSNGCTLCIRGKTSREWRELMKTVDIVIATPSIMGTRPGFLRIIFAYSEFL